MFSLVKEENEKMKKKTHTDKKAKPQKFMSQYF